jgi:trehalose 6-phosphate synthase/phosphatase
VIVICDKSKEVVQKWFEECKELRIAAEQGFYYKQRVK